MKDKEGSQYRHEEGDGDGSVKGSYGYTDDKGVYREVHYVADKQGFRAKINTNEPGTSNQDSADVEIQSNAKNNEHYTPLHHVHQGHYIPVYKEEVIPVFHKVEVAPIRPLKQFHNYKSYNYNNFSPIHGFSYRPSSFFNRKSNLGFTNGFRNNLRSHSGNFNINNNFGYSNLGSNFGNLNSFNDNEFDNYAEDLKNKKYYNNIDSFSSLGNVDNINGFDNLNIDNFGDFSNLGSYNKIGGYSNNGEFGSTYGFDGINKDKIEKLIEEVKQQNSRTYSSNNGKFNGNNDYQFKEFRNIGDHKYSRSSESDFN